MNLWTPVLTPSFIARARQLREDQTRRERRRRAALRAAYPRADELWSTAEDRRLLRLIARAKRERPDYRRWQRIADKLGRTTEAVRTRYYALRAGMRLR